MAFRACVRSGEESSMVSVQDSAQVATVLDTVDIALGVIDEISTPYTTMETAAVAALFAWIVAHGGDVIAITNDAPYYPGFQPEPEFDEAPDKATEKAIKLLAWGDNGLCANDKQAYTCILHMTKTRPGHDDPHVCVSLGAV